MFANNGKGNGNGKGNANNAQVVNGQVVKLLTGFSAEMGKYQMAISTANACIADVNTAMQDAATCVSNININNSKTMVDDAAKHAEKANQQSRNAKKHLAESFERLNAADAIRSSLDTIINDPQKKRGLEDAIKKASLLFGNTKAIVDASEMDVKKAKQSAESAHKKAFDLSYCPIVIDSLFATMLMVVISAGLFMKGVIYYQHQRFPQDVRLLYSVGIPLHINNAVVSFVIVAIVIAYYAFLRITKAGRQTPDKVPEWDYIFCVALAIEEALTVSYGLWVSMQLGVLDVPYLWDNVIVLLGVVLIVSLICFVSLYNTKIVK